MTPSAEVEASTPFFKCAQAKSRAANIVSNDLDKLSNDFNSAGPRQVPKSDRVEKDPQLISLLAKR